MCEMHRAMLAFSQTKSSEPLKSIDRLRKEATGPLQQYTVDVARLHMLYQLGERALAGEIAASCRQQETTYGFGSPLAARIGSHLSG